MVLTGRERLSIRQNVEMPRRSLKIGVGESGADLLFLKDTELVKLVHAHGFAGGSLYESAAQYTLDISGRIAPCLESKTSIGKSTRRFIVYPLFLSGRSEAVMGKDETELELVTGFP